MLEFSDANYQFFPATIKPRGVAYNRAEEGGLRKTQKTRNYRGPR